MINTIIETFTALPETAGTLLLLTLLITVFVIAYKTLTLFIQTAIISLLSALFYLTLWYIDYMAFSLRNLLLFTFLGAAIYLGLKILQTTYTIAKTTIKIPVEIIETFYKTLKFAKNTIQKIIPDRKQKNKRENQKTEKSKKSKKKEDPDDESHKEVVLDKLKDQEENEEKED